MQTPLYSVSVLEPVSGCSVSRAQAINDRGSVIGYSRREDAEVESACLWEGGIAQDLGRISVNAINDKGQIVGSRFTAFPQSFSAILCGNSQVRNLFQSNTATSDARDINDAGQVVGYAQTQVTKSKAAAGIKRGAFFWERGKRRYLETPQGYRTSQATGINSQGSVIGNVKRQDATDERNNEHAAVWQDGSVELLGEPEGFRSTQAEAVNDLGQILVRASIGAIFPESADDFEQKSYLWGDGHWQAIEGLGIAHSLNNHGQVVGWVGMEPSTTTGANEHGDVHAALWEAGNVVDLNDLVPKASEWILERAIDINNPGQIIGNGLFRGASRAFLLTPTVQTSRLRWQPGLETRNP